MFYTSIMLIELYLYYNTDKISVCLCVFSQTPLTPLLGLTSFLMDILISYPGVTLSIFHDLRSKVKSPTEVEVSWLSTLKVNLKYGSFKAYDV